MNSIGLQVSRYPSAASRRRQALLASCDVSTVIDVGANEGQYARQLRSHGFTGQIISVEPIPQVARKLRKHAARDANWTVLERAVTPTPGPISLNIAENLVSSSLREISEKHISAAPASRTISKVSVETISLAELLGRYQGKSILVKVDTQGYEREVLESAGSLLDEVALLEVEMSLQELYSGQELMREFDAWLVERNFRLVSLEEGFFDASSGELLQVDAIYRAKGQSFRRTNSSDGS